MKTSAFVFAALLLIATWGRLDFAIPLTVVLVYSHLVSPRRTLPATVR